MNLRQLDAFRATLRTGSVTEASKALVLSQPSVTRLIKDLERSVGFTLFVRNGRGITPTVEGRRFGDAVENLFTGTDRLWETAQAIRTSTDGEVLIGVTPVLVYQITPEAIGATHQNKPRLKISLRVNHSAGLIDSVTMGQLDFAVVNVHHRPESLTVFYEQELRYVCLLPQDHALAQPNSAVDLNQLQQMDCIAYDSSRLRGADKNWQTILSWPTVSLSAYSNIAVASLARSTGKPAIVDPYTARTMVALGGVTTRPLKQKLVSTLCVITRGADTMSLAARALAEAVVAELKCPEQDHTGIE
jgi:DNA-binding transcriptional LysR family regulator